MSMLSTAQSTIKLCAYGRGTCACKKEISIHLLPTVTHPTPTDKVDPLSPTNSENREAVYCNLKFKSYQ